MITEIKVKCLLELSKTLNFTKASENLYMTQQAVSNYILSLEQDLDVVLFTRSHHSVSLTEEGARFVSLFQKFQDEFNECIAESKKSRHYGKNCLSIGYLHWVYYGNAPHIAHIRMNELFSNFSLTGEMHSAKMLLTLLNSGSLDLIVLYKRLARNIAQYRYIELKEIPVMLMASKNMAASAENADFAYFASYPLIIDAEEQESESLTLEKASRFNITPSEIIVLPNRDSVYLSVELGHGITLGTSMSQTENRLIEKYSAGCTDKLICLWRKDERSHIAEKYAQFFYEALQT